MASHYWKIFSGIVFVKMILSYVVPITSDEAYFFTWAFHLDVNYYDHPPMIGWVIYLFSLLGRHIFFFRLFSVIAGALVALGIRAIVGGPMARPEKAAAVSLVFLTMPLHVLLVPITTDIPLFLFTFLAGATLYTGVRRNRDGWVLLAGFCLSLAILSKYFAALLMVGMFGYVVVSRRFRVGLLLAAGAAPMLLLHLYWNYQDCWWTIMFNVFNRNKEHTLGVDRFLEFLLSQVYLATPWVLYYVVRHARTIGTGLRKDGSPFFFLAAIPLGLLALLSFFDTSLHWTISFYPFVVLMLAYLETATLKTIVRLSAVFSLIHVVVVVGAMAVPHEMLRLDRQYTSRPMQFVNRSVMKYYNDIVMGFHGDEIDAALEPYRETHVFGTPGYTTAALMTYHSGRHYLVFNDDDRNGRNDDKTTDFKALDGKNLLILSTLRVKPNELAAYTEYFDDLVVDTLTVRDAEYTVVFGNGFRYDRYRELFLKRILTDCYAIPDYLPVGRCFFFDRYFPQRASRSDARGDT